MISTRMPPVVAKTQWLFPIMQRVAFEAVPPLAKHHLMENNRGERCLSTY
jgi:hypothetical protein